MKRAKEHALEVQRLRKARFQNIQSELIERGIIESIVENETETLLLHASNRNIKLIASK